jgi:hypothetical protein
VHLRRALLLFAIVVGLAAVAATMTRPREQRDSDQRSSAPPEATEGPSTASPGPGAPRLDVAKLLFDASRDQTRRLPAGRPATVVVRVGQPGQVEIPLLGVGASAEPLTPAVFDIATPEARRYPISFTPATDDKPHPAGTLAVTPVER